MYCGALLPRYILYIRQTANKTPLCSDCYSLSLNRSPCCPIQISLSINNHHHYLIHSSQNIPSTVVKFFYQKPRCYIDYNMRQRNVLYNVLHVYMNFCVNITFRKYINAPLCYIIIEMCETFLSKLMSLCSNEMLVFHRIQRYSHLENNDASDDCINHYEYITATIHKQKKDIAPCSQMIEPIRNQTNRDC